MKPEELDLVFHSLLTRFFSIRTRQAPSGSVTFAQMRLVWTIERHGPLPLTSLARMLGVGPSAATEVADRLVRSGHVRRTGSAEDRRRSVLSLTPRGQALLRRLALHRRERWRRVTRDLGAAGTRRLAAALETADELLGRCRD
jgi:DNA-binding MarR family transcriptional regulator